MSNEQQQVTASFILTRDLKQALDAWAAQSDRSSSAELRQILAREAARRNRQQQQQAAK